MATHLRGRAINTDTPADGDVLVYDITTKTWLLEGDVITEINKIDSAPVDGLAGTVDSLAYKMEEVEVHFHSPEEWYGKDAGDTFANRASITPWRITAGNSEAYGSLVKLSNGDEIQSGSTTKKFDFHRVLVMAASAAVAYKMEFYSPDTATLMTEMHYQGANTLRTAPIVVQTNRHTCNSPIWARCKSATNGATLDITFGVHIYAG